MKIALTNSWPNLPSTAELEFCNRFIIACARLGIEVRIVVTSDDINDFDPDAVLVTHEFTPKLTDHPTIGLLWSPLPFFERDERRKRNILSYDGYAVGSMEMENYANDIQFRSSIKKPVSAELFLPTTYSTSRHALRDTANPSLCYMGVHWDGLRHARIFDALTSKGLISLYGPRQKWNHLGDSYKGELPFDGVSVIETIARHGITLCFHKKQHRDHNVPSMRVFEALSVGALPICDSIEFAKTHLGEIALFVDTDQSTKRVVDAIEEHLNWIERQPSAAAERAERGKAWFDARWSLEEKIKTTLLPLIDETKAAGHFHGKRRRVQISKAESKSETGSAVPDCEIVVRTGGRGLDCLKRAIASIIAADSETCRLGLIAVDYCGRADIKAYIENEASKHIPARYIRAPSPGVRSTALWVGLKAVRSKFAANLDDDDLVYSTHYRQLHASLLAHPDAPASYSGTIRIDENDELYVKHLNFEGPLANIIKERRELHRLDPYSLSRLAHFDDFIASNAWMARTEVLQAVMDGDPRLEVEDNIYLLLLLAQQGAFTFTNGATAVWQSRNSGSDPAQILENKKAKKQECARIVQRLSGATYKVASDLATLRQLLPDHVPKAAAPPAPIGGDIFPLDIGVRIEGRTSLVEYANFIGFHPPEEFGIWSSQAEAKVYFRIDREIQRAGGAIRLEYLASFDGNAKRRVHFELDSAQTVSVEIVDWGMRQIEFTVPPASPEMLAIRISVDGVVEASKRNLGVLIKAVTLLDNRQLAEQAGYQDGKQARASEQEKVAISITPKLEYRELGRYQHVDIKYYRDGGIRSACKLQNSNGRFRVQFAVEELAEDTTIPNEYVELDKNGPVFRIHFAAGADEVSRRMQHLPVRMRSALRDICVIKPAEDWITGAGENTSHALAYFWVAQKKLSELLRAIGIENNRIVVPSRHPDGHR